MLSGAIEEALSESELFFEGGAGGDVLIAIALVAEGFSAEVIAFGLQIARKVGGLEEALLLETQLVGFEVVTFEIDIVIELDLEGLIEGFKSAGGLVDLGFEGGDLVLERLEFLAEVEDRSVEGVAFGLVIPTEDEVAAWIERRSIIFFVPELVGLEVSMGSHGGAMGLRELFDGIAGEVVEAASDFRLDPRGERMLSVLELFGEGEGGGGRVGWIAEGSDFEVDEAETLSEVIGESFGVEVLGDAMVVGFGDEEASGEAIEDLFDTGFPVAVLRVDLEEFGGEGEIGGGEVEVAADLIAEGDQAGGEVSFLGGEPLEFSGLFFEPSGELADLELEGRGLGAFGIAGLEELAAMGVGLLTRFEELVWRGDLDRETGADQEIIEAKAGLFLDEGKVVGLIDSEGELAETVTAGVFDFDIEACGFGSQFLEELIEASQFGLVEVDAQLPFGAEGFEELGFGVMKIERGGFEELELGIAIGGMLTVDFACVDDGGEPEILLSGADEQLVGLAEFVEVGEEFLDTVIPGLSFEHVMSNEEVE